MQCFDTPQEVLPCSLSLTVINLILQRLECTALTSLNNQLPFYYRYLDDLFMFFLSNG